MKFKKGQIYYLERFNELVLVTDVDATFSRAKLVYDADIYISSFFPDMIYIGEL